MAQVLGHPAGLEVSDVDQVEEKVCSGGRDRRAPELSRSENRVPSASREGRAVKGAAGNEVPGRRSR